VLFRFAILAVAAAFPLTMWTGCAVTSPAAAVLAQAVAPVQSQRPDPNAPYMIPAPVHPVAAQVAPVAAGQASPCSPDALKVQEIAGNMHGDYHSIKLGFRNQTGVACRLSGYPMVALFNGQGQNLGSIAVERTTTAEVRAELGEPAPQRAGAPGSPQSANGPASSAAALEPVSAGTVGSSSPVVVVMPKEVAAFQVVWSAGENCSSVARLLITPPGTTRTFSVSQPMSVCGGRIQVTPLSLDQGDD